MEGHHVGNVQPDDIEHEQDGLIHRLRHALIHDHGSVHENQRDTSAEGIRATKISLIVLGVTAALQAVIVVFSGSIALLSDTLHNLADALTAIPLWIAFSLGRRRPTKTYTYGFHRAEDIAGLLIVLAIGASALLIALESIERLLDPRLFTHVPWVIAAGLVGAFGNELVARHRMRVGRSIGSEALVADGRHARSDAWTSLAVVAAGIGAALGAWWVDPIAGLLVTLVIIRLLITSAKGIGRRLLDGVDPALVARAETVILDVDGVRDVGDLRLRFHGHQLNVTASIAVDPDISVRFGHDTALEVEHALHHAFDFPVVATIHIDPHGMEDSHRLTDHHR
ncbi:MAG TPA: cation diffusion facilitator family transporter [Acidimicrobiia bacterium]|nr:cation diffusion facilitator family transporter [Acidimicrobiia bacterium]